MNPPQSDNVIRISREEVLSEHVDDMLKRQMSLRGDPGVQRDRKRHWWYQNWLVLGLVGMLGAVAAWAVLEPYYFDMLYIQGPVTDVKEVSLPPQLRHAFEAEGGPVYDSLTVMTVNGEEVFVSPWTSEILPDGSRKHFKPAQLAVGDRVGAYVHFAHDNENAGDGVIYAGFITRQPPSPPPSQAALSLTKQQARQAGLGLFMFSIVAAFIGLFVGAADGIVCRLPRRALISGSVGLLVGLVGGFICSIVANIIYSPLSHLALELSRNSYGLSTIGFLIQVVGRSLAWCLAGMAMGLGQGIALRSKRLLLYGLIGGLVGGLLGGLLFDPIDLILLGQNKPSAHWSRLAGFAVIGLSVGAMIGIVELLARDAWLRMTQGPLTGKEFLIFKDVMNVGASPRSDIYLFNDPLVAEQHAIIRAMGDECDIEARSSTNPVLLNSRPITRARLRHGDAVTIGRTSFTFQQRKS